MSTAISSFVERIRRFSMSQDDAESRPAKKYGPPFNVARLPAEIRLSLLKAADNLFTLRCLATSSAAFLLVYNQNRQQILEAVMGRSVDLSLIPESAFASATSRIDFEAPDVAAQIARFLQKYHQRKESPTPGRITGLFNKVEQARHMKKLYPVVEELAADFCQRSSEYLGLDTDPITYDSCSALEKHRLYRAFFRYELFSNLYRDRGLCVDYESHKYAPGLLNFSKNFVYRDDYDESAVDDEHMSKDFLVPFTPGEVYEFASIHHYSLHCWAELMHEVEVHMAASVPLSPDDRNHLKELSPNHWGYDQYRRHFSVLGLEFLHSFLKGHKTIGERWILMRNNLYAGNCDPASIVDDYAFRLTQFSGTSNPAHREPLTNPTFELWETKFAKPGDPEILQNMMSSDFSVFWDEDRVKALSEKSRRKKQIFSVGN